jgi:pimeloyl-ACP methyl ester carboxylesterase
MAYAQLDGIRLYYETAGTGPPVVLVNSMGTTLRTWDRVIADLAADHHVVAYDWRGCGRSERTWHGNSIEQNAADLLNLIAYLGLDRPVLAGVSAGALFACHAAHRAEEKVGGVVVIDGPGHAGTLAAGALRSHMDALAADRAATVSRSAANMYSAQASGELRAWTARQVLDASPHIDALYDEQTRYDPRSWLPHLTVPVCYVHGALDKAVPIGIARELAALTPGSTLVPVEGAGHMAHQEAPAEVAAAIRALVRRVQEPPPTSTSMGAVPSAQPLIPSMTSAVVRTSA